MSIHKYEAFLKTIELGSLTKAAQYLKYTQSGISHMIKALEDELDLTLLSRNRSGVNISSAGRELLPYFISIYNEQRRLMEKVNDLHGLNCGMIRIGTFSSISVQWLPRALKSFQEKYNNIDFEMYHGDYYEIENWIMQGRVDCGIVALPAKKRLETSFLIRDRFVAILPENHPLSTVKYFNINELINEPYIKIEDGEDNEIGAILDKYNIIPNVRFVAKDDYAIMSMVENGLGISILPELCLQRMPYKIIKKELNINVFRDIGIAFKNLNQLSSATKHFIEHVNNLPTEQCY